MQLVGHMETQLRREIQIAPVYRIYRACRYMKDLSPEVRRVV